jgi:hypothetical protein
LTELDVEVESLMLLVVNRVAYPASILALLCHTFDVLKNLIAALLPLVPLCVLMKASLSLGEP